MTTQDDQRRQKCVAALEFAERQVEALTNAHPDFFPIYTEGGKWRHEGELWTDWTGGFLAGMMWQFHLRNNSDHWRQKAEHYSRLLEHRQHDRNVHDLGFFTLDGTMPTNGFQPLWMLVQMLLHGVAPDGADGVRLLAMSSWLAYVGFAFLATWYVARGTPGR